MTSSTTTELAKYEASSLDERMEYARMISTAGDLVPSGFHDPLYREGPNGTQLKVAGQLGAVNPGKVFLAFEYGAMLGLHPLAALMGIHVIEGKPAASAGLISSLVRTAGHRLRVTTSGSWDDGTFEAVAELVRSDDSEFTFRAVWTKRDAERAGLLGKDNWVKYPSSMSKARAITAVAREGAEEALLGVHYTPEELGAAVDANGEVLVVEEGEPSVADAEPVKATRKTPARGRQGTKRKAAPVDMTPPEKSAEEHAADLLEDAPAAEEIVDAEVVEETPTPEPDAAEREEAERRATEAAAAEARYREEDASSESQAEALAEPPAEVTDDGVAQLRAQQAAEVQRQQARLAESKPEPQQEHTARPYVDTIDGKTYATEAELLEAQKARVKAKQAARAAEAEQAVASGEPSAFDLALTEEPDNYQRQIDAATTLDECKDVWQRATDAKAMDSALRLAVIRQKAILEQASA